jgi:hypothetical protein
MTKDTYVNSLTQSLYCDGKLEQQPIFAATLCGTCQLPVKSKQCQEVHTSGFCKRNYTRCKKCDRLIRGTLTSNTVQKHKCSLVTNGEKKHVKQEFCPICYSDKIPGEMHLCPWSEAKKYERLENLGFVNFSYSTDRQICAFCDTPSSQMCQLHPFGPADVITPVMASVYFEEGSHERFALSHFYHPMFTETPKTVRDVFSFKYMPDGLGLSKTLSRKKETCAFNKPKGKDLLLNESLASLRGKPEKASRSS